MPKVTIDGKTIEVEVGTTIIKAAERLGIYIPRYCYLKALSVVATCRMCLVEVEKAPKLMTACSTPVTDGMVVYTDTEKVRRARQDILEFLLINHPLDCPICDQAGECFLQDYYMDYGRYKSRFPLELKIRRPKRRKIGKYLVLDNERCILCTRCVRFLQEITKTNELCVRERGDSSEIDLFQGRYVDNNYSLNLADICPVGAITSADFRFKKRVWYLEGTPSICLGCATGCNVLVQYSNGTIYRLLPRENPEVNGLWMCDTGRITYKIQSDNGRILNPCSLRKGRAVMIDYQEVLNAVEAELKNIIKTHGPDAIGVLGSGELSLEDNFALATFARNVLKTRYFCSEFPIEQGISDGILFNKDPLPNTKGAGIIHKAMSGISLQEFVDAINSGKIKFLILAGKDIVHLGKDDRALIEKANLKTLGFFYTSEHAIRDIDFVFPTATYFETRGLFINFAGRIQKTEPAIRMKEGVKPVWAYLVELSHLLRNDAGFKDQNSLLEKMRKSVQALENIDYDNVGLNGIMVGG